MGDWDGTGSPQADGEVATGEKLIAYSLEVGNDLVFGLGSQGDSPYSGVVLIDNDDDADIEIYLVNNTPAPAATPEAQDELALISC